MIFAELIFGGVQIRRSQKKLMLIHICNQNPFTLIFRYYYSIEELGGREGGGGGKKPSPKPGKKIGTDQAARPLAGAEVLVAVRGPSPRCSGGGKKKIDPCGRTVPTASQYPRLQLRIGAETSGIAFAK